MTKPEKIIDGKDEDGLSEQPSGDSDAFDVSEYLKLMKKFAPEGSEENRKITEIIADHRPEGLLRYIAELRKMLPDPHGKTESDAE